jgi:hypothetical protein
LHIFRGTNIIWPDPEIIAMGSTVDVGVHRP